MIETLKIRLEVRRRKDSDLILAYSDDLKGLLVPARSMDELRAAMPQAITEILEAQGHRVLEVIDAGQDDNTPQGFIPAQIHAQAKLQAA